MWKIQQILWKMCICVTNCVVAQNIVHLHKLYCNVDKNIVNLYNYTNCIVLYTNCKIYARRVVRIMHIILWISTFAQQNIMYHHIYTNCDVFYTTFKNCEDS